MKAIANCDIVNDAWEKLGIKNKATESFKKTRLWGLITKLKIKNNRKIMVVSLSDSGTIEDTNE